MMSRREMSQSCISNKLSKLTLATFDEEGKTTLAILVNLHDIENHSLCRVLFYTWFIIKAPDIQKKKYFFCMACCTNRLESIFMLLILIHPSYEGKYDHVLLVSSKISFYRFVDNESPIMHMLHPIVWFDSNFNNYLLFTGRCIGQSGSWSFSYWLWLTNLILFNFMSCLSPSLKFPFMHLNILWTCKFISSIEYILLELWGNCL